MLDGLGWRVGVLSERLLSYIYTILGQASSIKRIYFMLWDGIVHFWMQTSYSNVANLSLVPTNFIFTCSIENYFLNWNLVGLSCMHGDRLSLLRKLYFRDQMSRLLVSSHDLLRLLICLRLTGVLLTSTPIGYSGSTSSDEDRPKWTRSVVNVCMHLPVSSGGIIYTIDLAHCTQVQERGDLWLAWLTTSLFQWVWCNTVTCPLHIPHAAPGLWPSLEVQFQ